MLKAISQHFFHLILGNRLIYNTCWEDPRIDRQLLKLDENSMVVMITSAGCNALDYLLDSPGFIHTVDVNSRQNALLQLKLALIKHRSHDDLFALLGRGSHWAYRDIFKTIRHYLPLEAKTFWDDKIKYFSHKGMRPSFYWRGAAGDFAWLFNRLFFGLRKRVHRMVFDLIDSENLQEQEKLYEEIEPKIWGDFSSWLVRQPALMAMVGVPRQQIQLVDREHPLGLSGFIQEKLRRVMTQIPLRDNYFWRVYITGSYTPDCCPNYLQKGNFQKLRGNIDKVKTYSSTLTDFLRCYPGEYSHFILLDHQDWLAWHDPQALQEEWQLILQNSRPGTKILMRSAALKVNFIPVEAKQRLHFFPELTDPLHFQDRVGTYSSLHLAEVQQ